MTEALISGNGFAFLFVFQKHLKDRPILKYDDHQDYLMVQELCHMQRQPLHELDMAGQAQA